MGSKFKMAREIFIRPGSSRFDVVTAILRIDPEILGIQPLGPVSGLFHGMRHWFLLDCATHF